MLRFICEDWDADCEDVKCKESCYMYDTSKGLCPYVFPGILAPLKNPLQIVDVKDMV
jgi:hypothetical protein